MMPYRDSRITRTLLIIFFILLLGYAYYEARGYLFGPRITVASPTSEATTTHIVIQGQAERIANLSMNGKAITVTESGYFEEPYLLAPGLNYIILDANDKYGRTTQEVLKIVYTSPSNIRTASSTAPIQSATSTKPRVQATTTVETGATSTPLAP